MIASISFPQIKFISASNYNSRSWKLLYNHWCCILSKMYAKIFVLQNLLIKIYVKHASVHSQLNIRHISNINISIKYLHIPINNTERDFKHKHWTNCHTVKIFSTCSEVHWKDWICNPHKTWNDPIANLNNTEISAFQSTVLEHAYCIR